MKHKNKSSVRSFLFAFSERFQRVNTVGEVLTFKKLICDERPNAACRHVRVSKCTVKCSAKTGMDNYLLKKGEARIEKKLELCSKYLQ